MSQAGRAAYRSGDRQARDLPLDSHLHTDLSPDSEVPIDDYARQAVARGIPEIAITDHVDFEPGTPAFAYNTFGERERVAREAAERWSEHGLTILFGVEVTFDRRWADDIRDHLARHTYDFAIGSVHIYRGSPYAPDGVARWVAGRSLGEIVAPYFEEVTAAAASGLFDAIGHIDFVKRFLASQLDPATITAAPELYEPILTALVESGTALEINTSGLRQEPNEAYPAPSIVRRFVELGGRAVTVGSDAHSADSFAWGLDDGYRAAAEAGIDVLTVGRGSDARHVDIPGAPNAVAGHSL